MLSHILTTLLSLASIASATDIPTLYLVGDGTMAEWGDNVTQGWGPYINYYMHGLNVVNMAKHVQTARSYREKHWKDVEDLLEYGDFVVIEFGITEVMAAKNDNYWSYPGEGDSHNVTFLNGTMAEVYTWQHYILDMIDGAKSKNATPIISSHTPMDPYRIPGFFLNDLTPWVGFAAAIAEASDVPYVDHFGSTIDIYAQLNKTEVVKSFFPKHNSILTSPLAALLVAKTFIKGLTEPAARGVLSSYINPNAGNISFHINATNIPISPNSTRIVH